MDNIPNTFNDGKTLKNQDFIDLYDNIENKINEIRNKAIKLLDLKKNYILDGLIPKVVKNYSNNYEQTILLSFGRFYDSINNTVVELNEKNILENKDNNTLLKIKNNNIEIKTYKFTNKENFFHILYYCISKKKFIFIEYNTKDEKNYINKNVNDMFFMNSVEFINYIYKKKDLDPNDVIIAAAFKVSTYDDEKTELFNRHLTPRLENLNNKKSIDSINVVEKKYLYEKTEYEIQFKKYIDTLKKYKYTETLDYVESFKKLYTSDQNYIIDGLRAETKFYNQNPKQLMMFFGSIWDSKNKRIITLGYNNKNIKFYDKNDIDFDDNDYKFKMEYISDLNPNKYFIIYYRISDNTFYYTYPTLTEVENNYKYKTGPNKGEYYSSIDFIKKMQQEGSDSNRRDFFGTGGLLGDFVILVCAKGTKDTPDNVKAKPLDRFLTPRFEDKDFIKNLKYINGI